MQHNIYIYILVMFAVTYLIRVLPLTLIRREIKINHPVISVLCALCHTGCYDISGYHGSHKQPRGRTCCPGGRYHTGLVRTQPLPGSGAVLCRGICAGAFYVNCLSV